MRLVRRSKRAACAGTRGMRFLLHLYGRKKRSESIAPPCPESPGQPVESPAKGPSESKVHYPAIGNTNSACPRHGPHLGEYSEGRALAERVSSQVQRAATRASAETAEGFSRRGLGAIRADQTRFAEAQIVKMLPLPLVLATGMACYCTAVSETKLIPVFASFAKSKRGFETAQRLGVSDGNSCVCPGDRWIRLPAIG